MDQPRRQVGTAVQGSANDWCWSRKPIPPHLSNTCVSHRIRLFSRHVPPDIHGASMPTGFQTCRLLLSGLSSSLPIPMANKGGASPLWALGQSLRAPCILGTNIQSKQSRLSQGIVFQTGGWHFLFQVCFREGFQLATQPEKDLSNT